MRITFKYRLNPSPAQRTALQQQLDCCRFVYNQALATRKSAYEERQASLSRYDTVKLIPQWKEEHQWLKAGHAQAMQEALTRLDLAFRAFFRRLKAGDDQPGYPRFRGKGWYDSFTYPQEKSNWRFLANGKVRLAKIGDVKIKLHRPLKGESKTLTIRRGIADVAWGQFVQFTTYKAASAGRGVALVNPKGTTQSCSGCGEIVAKELSVRLHDCPTCGLKLNRDHNAALNILALGLQSMGGYPLGAIPRSSPF